MRWASVCSGISAPSVAWAPLGWRECWSSEIDPFCRALLQYHYPEVTLYDDFTTIDKPESVDLLIAGTPCQSFSVAGQRAGLDDARGVLALEYLKLVGRVRPRWVVWENVPGVLSSWSDAEEDEEGNIWQTNDFDTFVNALGELGYGWAYRVLDAQYFGVAQRRRRVFVVGYLGDWRPAAAVLFEAHCLSGYPAPSRSASSEITGTLDTGAGCRRGKGINPSALCTTALNTRGQRNDGTVETFVINPLTTDPYADNGTQEDQLIVFDTQQITSAANRASVRPGQPAPTLNAAPGLRIAGTLPASGKAAGSATQQDAECNLLISHTLRGEGFDASEDGTGRGSPLIVTHQCAGTLGSNARGGLRTTDLDGIGAYVTAFGCKDSTVATGKDVSPTLRGMQHVKSQANGGGQVAVVIGGRDRGDDGRGYGREPHISNLPACDATKPDRVLGPQLVVRRLTPREYERLQGFPDDYTLIPTYRRKMRAHEVMQMACYLGIPIDEACRIGATPDGPRYRAIGNSQAIPVIFWIGERIDTIERILSQMRSPNNESQNPLILKSWFRQER